MRIDCFHEQSELPGFYKVIIFTMWDIIDPVLCVCVNSSQTGLILDKVQEFITNLSSFTEEKSQRLSEEVSTNQI